MDYTVNEVKIMLSENDVPAEILAIFAEDGRESVRKLLLQYHKRQAKCLAELERLNGLFRFERSFFARGMQPVAGTDEAGRGPLAGPVVAAAVILPLECRIIGLDDSKKIPEPKRERLFNEIYDKAIAVSYAVIEPALIDEINIYQASRRAMTQALNALAVRPGAIISDAMPLPDIDYAEVLAMEKADSKSASVAAASIIAKVVRDRIMREIDVLLPQYGFASNKGYGTEAHVHALKTYGASIYHRRSFAPVADVFEKQLGK